MIDKSDLGTAGKALQLIKHCRTKAKKDISKMQAQNPSAVRLDRLKGEILAADWTIPYLEAHIEMGGSVSSSSNLIL